jgi:hypothetical protein
MMKANDTASDRRPTCHLVVVYENDISEANWVPQIEHELFDFSKTLHSIGFRPLQLEGGGFRWSQSTNNASNSGRTRSDDINSTNALVATTRSTTTTYSKDMLATASSNLITDVLTKDKLGIDYKRTRYPPVFFVGVGFGALVVMDTILRTKNSIPMGAVMTSVTEDGVTARSNEFKRWYASLKQEGNEDIKMLTQLLKNFNRHCHQEHIRLSCISRDIDEEVPTRFPSLLLHLAYFSTARICHSTSALCSPLAGERAEDCETSTWQGRNPSSLPSCNN